MNREIKFELIKDNKIVGLETHRDGLIFHYSNDERGTCSIMDCPESYVPHDNKRQCTGLQDKNGKDIYEGDILLQDNKHKYQVYWDDAGFNIGTINAGICKVIGNIYENEELLK